MRGNVRPAGGLRVARAAATAVLLAPVLVATPPDDRRDRFVQRVWAVRDGLPRGGILGLAPSRSGLLWVSTREGPLLFDGTTFTPLEDVSGISLAPQGEAPILEDRAGGVWLGFWGRGLVHVTAGGARLITSADGLPSHLVTSLCEDRSGVVWAGTRGGLARIDIDAGRVTPLGAAQGLPDTSVRCLLSTRDGTLYAGTLGGGLAILREGRFTTLTRRDGLPSDYILSLLEASDGRVIAGTGEGVCALEGGSVKTFGMERKGLVYSLAEDKTGRIWATLFAYGLHVLLDERFVRVLAGPDGLGESPVALLGAPPGTAAGGAEGALWAATMSGLHRVSEGTGRTLPLAGGTATAVLEDEAGRLVVATTNGLDVLSREGAFHLGRKEGLEADTVWALARGPSGSVLIGTDGAGTLELTGRRLRSLARNADERTDSVASLLVDRDGRLWAGTYGRGLRGPRNSFRPHRPGGRPPGERNSFGPHRPGGRPPGERDYTKRDGLSSDTVIQLLEGREGSIWIGTTAGLDRLETSSGTLGRVADLPEGVTSLHEDSEGALWIGTLGGLVRRSPRGALHRFTPGHGLPAMTVTQLVEDRAGRLWLGGSAGYLVVSRAALVAVSEGRSAAVSPVFLGPSDGLRGFPGGGGSQPTAALLGDGRLAFPTDRGLALADPSRLPAPRPTRPRLTRLLADGRLLWSAFRHFPAGGIDLPPGTRTLQLAYSAFSPDAGEGTTFRHRLEGFDREWIEDGDRTSVTYTNLKPGPYTFTLEARGRGVAGEAPAVRLPLVRRPLFVETVLFRVLAGAGALLFAFGLYRQRVSRLEARSAVLEERNRIAREVHDTLSHSLAGIATQLEVASLTLSREPHAAGEHVEGARALARSSLDEARRSVRALRPLALDNTSLAQALSGLLSRLRPGQPDGGAAGAGAAGAPRLVARVASELPRLDAEVEEQLFRVAQEAVTNALRHSGAREIAVELSGSPRELTLSVSDDGRGFTQAAGGTGGGPGLGLVGMRERVRRIRGTLELASVPGGGTRIQVRVPVSRSFSSVRSRIETWLRASAS